MQSMTISNFKAHALKVLDNLSKTKESVIVTKRGKPLVTIIPFESPDRKQTPGLLADTNVYEGDLLSSIDETWSVDQ